MPSVSPEETYIEAKQILRSTLPCYDELKRFFVLRVRSPQDAEDLAQETYVRISKWVPRHSVVQPRQALFRIARNLLIDRSRKKVLPVEASGSDSQCHLQAISHLSPAHSLEAKEKLQTVQKAIAEMPDRCQEVFYLNRFEGLSYAQIASRLNISKSTVEKHMIRAIASCKKALK